MITNRSNPPPNLDDLPMLEGSYGSVRGFAYKNKDDNVRYQTLYGSEKERLWCECGDLMDHNLWEEAEKKNEELVEYSDGFCDMGIEAQLRFGLAMNDIENDDKFEMARQALLVQRQLVDGGRAKLSKRLYKLTEARVRSIVPHDPASSSYPAYEEATTEALVDAAKLWLEMASRKHPTSCTDSAYDQSNVLLQALVDRGEFQKARTAARALLKADPAMKVLGGPDTFLAAVAECSESLGDTADAHKAYERLKMVSEKRSDGDIYAEGNNNGDNVFCLKLPRGTIAERIDRTK